MTNNHAIMKSRAGAMSFVAEGFSNRFSAIRAQLSARAERRRVYAELSAMSDRDLADIGVNRGEVPRIAGFTDFPALALIARR